MDLVSGPETLECSECGDAIDDTGYVPATERDDGHDPRVDAALCGTCGFNDVGMMGCAPELDEVVDPGPDDVLLHVRATDDGIEVLSAKD